MKINVTVPATTFDLFLGWLNLSWTNEAVTCPREIPNILLDHAMRLSRINPANARIEEVTC
jgi:hypothetical protein